ncbi:MAG: ribosome-associated translation inhibitor RaiA [Flavobacteriales bacterium]|nr:ribosome-associated translation inhibitor RaiA [Flavobacteriales bacterium]
MQINIQAIHFDPKGQLVELIESKVEGLQKLGDISSCEIFLKLEGSSSVRNKQVEIKIKASNTTYFAKSDAESFEIATDQAVEGMRRQLRKQKGKVLNY